MNRGIIHDQKHRPQKHPSIPPTPEAMQEHGKRPYPSGSRFVRCTSREFPSLFLCNVIPTTLVSRHLFVPIKLFEDQMQKQIDIDPSHTLAAIRFS